MVSFFFFFFFFYECHSVFDKVVTSDFGEEIFHSVPSLALNVHVPACVRGKSVTLDGETSDVLTAEHKRESKSLKLD